MGVPTLQETNAMLVARDKPLNSLERKDTGRVFAWCQHWWPRWGAVLDAARGFQSPFFTETINVAALELLHRGGASPRADSRAYEFSWVHGANCVEVDEDVRRWIGVFPIETLPTAR